MTPKTRVPLTQLVTVREVANALRLSEDEVRRRARSGELPGFREGQRIVFHAAAIERIIRDLTVASA